MEYTIKMALAILMAIGIPLTLTPLVKKVAWAAGAVDEPDNRRVNRRPVPSWGGLTISAGFFMAAAILLPLTGEMRGLLYGGLLILAIGMIDDWLSLPPWVKLAGQIGAAAILVFFGVTVKFLTNPFGGMINLGLASIPVTIIWVVAITNALNLSDGLDGLAAGISVISAATVAIIAYGQGSPVVAILALLLAAASLGFLPHNFHPAKIFMGDTGAMFIGYLLAALSIFGLTKSATAFSLILPVLILGIPISDMVFAIIRRTLGGQGIFTADKDHLHHRLLAMGLSHRQTVLVIYAINIILGACAVLLTYLTTDQGVALLFLLLAAVLVAANRVGLFEMRRNSRGAGGSRPSHYKGIGR